MGTTTGYYAVRFTQTDSPPLIRITSRRVHTPLEAVDDVLGTRYSAPNPMVIDVLREFDDVRVKCIATTMTQLRNDKYRIAQLTNTDDWIQPSYPPELVARVRRNLANKRKEKVKT